MLPFSGTFRSYHRQDWPQRKTTGIYFSYVVVEFSVSRPIEATHCTDWGKIGRETEDQGPINRIFYKFLGIWSSVEACLLRDSYDILTVYVAFMFFIFLRRSTSAEVMDVLPRWVRFPKKISAKTPTLTQSQTPKLTLTLTLAPVVPSASQWTILSAGYRWLNRRNILGHSLSFMKARYWLREKTHGLWSVGR